MAQDTPEIDVIQAGTSTALFIPAECFISAMKRLGLLPKDWQPKERPDDEPAKIADRR
jgi:hypothetical protein